MGFSSQGWYSLRERSPRAARAPGRAAARDAGKTTSEAGPEASAGDGGSDDGGPDCGAGAPTGTQILAATTQLVVKGLTYDGNYALYVDTGMQTLNAVPVAGGKAVTLGPYKTDALQPTTTGALFYVTLDPATGVGPLWAWTPATGASSISMNASAVGGQDMSSDGSLVAYVAPSPTDGTGTLTLTTADGKAQTPLVANIDLQNCSVVVEFVGSTLVAAYCLASPADGGTAGDGGAPVQTVASFAGSGAPSSFARTLVGEFDPSQFGYFIPVDPSGAQMPLVGASGLGLYPIAGGAPTAVDANGAGGAIFAPNGDLIYSTTSGAVSRYSSMSATSTPLIATGGYYAAALSSDGNWMQLDLNTDSNTGATDVYLASATTAGSPLREWPTTTANVAGFSSDSKFELFVTGATTFKNTTYDFYASPVSGGAPTKVATIASLGWLSGSKMVFTDNYTVMGMADVEVLDLAKPAAKQTLVTQADFNLQVTPTNQIVYSWYCQANSMAGIWVATSP